MSGLGYGIASCFAAPQKSWAAQASSKAEAPAQRSAISFEDGVRATSWLNFEMPDFRRIILEGAINGIPARILLDTGIGTVVIDEGFAATLGMSEAGAVTGLGVANRASGHDAEGVHIAFDNLTVSTPAATIFDLTPLSRAFDDSIAALLGRDVFESLIVDIDFENQRLSFLDPATKRSLPGATALPLAGGPSGRRRVPISVEGRSPIQASFDLGSDSALLLAPDYVSKQKLLNGKKTSDAIAIGIGGESIAQIAVVDDVNIGGTTFSRVPIQVPEIWTLECPAVIGFPVLRRLRMIVDYPHDRLFVLPNKKAIGTPIRKDRSGIGAQHAGETLQIVHVARNSPAEAAGLRVGDEVVAINDEKLGPDYFKSHPTVGSMAAGTIFYLTLASGSKIKLVLADYY